MGARSPGRRRVITTLAGTAAAGCAPEADPARQTDAPPATSRPDPTVAPAATATAAPMPAPAPTATAIPAPALRPLGVSRVVQPLWAADRILYYDNPAAGQDGTWSVSGGATPEPPVRERAQWGYYWASGRLLAEPRPSRRDTYVLHAPSGQEWALPTTNTPIFSPDGTLVAYPTAAAGQPGGAPPAPAMGFSGPAPAFVLSSVVLAGADGQAARTIQLPVNGSALAWVPGADGTPNAALLLTGRRAANDDPSLWLFDTRDRALTEITRSRRLVGALPSPDGTLVAWVAMWNVDAAQNGLWVARFDGGGARRVPMVGSYRWTADNRLIVIPHRSGPEQPHDVWSFNAANGESARLLNPGQPAIRVSNFDWDCSPDGSALCFVSSEDKGLWLLRDLRPQRPVGAAAPPEVPPPAATGTPGSPYRLPFTTPPGPSTWYVTHWYGVTTGGYRGRNSTYSQGQGIHFGIDFAAPCGSEVVAVAAGRVIAIDGDYGSPPHNVVIQLFDGNIAMYGHLVERTRHVQLGQSVEPGQVVGNTGDSIAPYNCTRNPHLHLEIRKRGRATATNPAPYFAANWDDMTLGVWPGPRFERDLDNPGRNQFLDEQPDIFFGGPIITNFARPWPPA